MAKLSVHMMFFWEESTKNSYDLIEICFLFLYVLGGIWYVNILSPLYFLSVDKFHNQ